MRQRFTLLAVMALTVIVYWPGLAGPLVLDDRANLEPLLRWMHGEIGWRSIVFSNLSGPLGRPVSMASFLANVALTGESVYWMKATNLVIHLMCGAAIYALMSTWMRLKAFVPDAPAVIERWAPCMVTAIWLLHPLLVSTVLYVVQRMAMLAALFMLLAMLAYLHGRIALIGGRRIKAAMLLGIAMPASVVLAMLSKENGVMAIALCGLMELLIFVPPVGRRRAWPSYGFIATTLVLPAGLAAGLTLAGYHLIVGGYANRSFTLAERLMTQPRVLWDYLGAILLPNGPRLGLYHDDFPISHNWLSPATTLPALLAWIGVVVAAWHLRRRAPALALGLGVFLVGQALESTVFPLLMYFEHRVYMSSIGIIWAIAGLATMAGQALHRRMNHGNIVFVAAPMTLLIALGLATAARASIWRNQESILQQSLATHPDSRWLRMDLIADDMAQKPHRTDDALAHADHLMSRPDPLDRRFGAMLRLSVECLEGREITPPRIEQIFGGRPRAVEPDLLVGLESLADRTIARNCQGFSPREMADALSGMLDRTALPKDDRSLWRLRFKCARLYFASGDIAPALRQSQLAYSGSGDPAPGLMAVGLLLRRGDIPAADRLLNQVARKIPGNDFYGMRIVATYKSQISSAAPHGKPGDVPVRH